MGYLLKEALKTLCGVNQWSYAVFWKIGCQNPKLLIWEECYYETAASCSENPEKVHLLVNKMMMDNHVNIVGEGLVGRVAFTGTHQWILSENYFREAHPPEVLKEVCQQFSVGMQTVAVVPVLPHGVVQLGSFLKIKENTGFVNDVASLILQLGYVSGLLSEDYVANDHAPVGFSEAYNSFNYVGNPLPASMVDTRASFPTARQIQNELQSNNGAGFPSSTPPGVKFDFSNSTRLMNGVAKAEVIPSVSEIWMNQHASSPYVLSSSTLNQGRFSSPIGVLMPNSGSIYCSEASSSKYHLMESKFAQSELKQEMEPNTNKPLSQDNDHLSMAELIPCFVEDDKKLYDDSYFQQETGDDLFDVLGADFKNKLFNSCLNNESTKHLSSSEIHMMTSQGNSDSGIFSITGTTDHLLEAVVSKVHSSAAKQNLDDNVSCGTTLTNLSSSSAPSMKGELFGVPKYLSKAGGGTSSCSLRTSSLKEESGSFSQGSSIYGSQISSWIGKDQKAKQNNSVSTGYSKKPDETSKTNRKRLKPGENPRPRPKDRQMIQDRVKELREIVPNGAKCSIDALLERTIKHMLFLQSVTKHADKLKQTGESKIISKDGGLLLKDNFEGGATWAYEVGSQSMVCPIIVEDLNQPRQMLVEMLCEERGLFLEIADIIRGLGLTILKGVMETRNDKIWARFAVEANRDVTRMEIFISLVRLLEQNTKTGVAQPNAINIENSMAQQFHQVAPIPITGRSHP